MIVVVGLWKRKWRKDVWYLNVLDFIFLRKEKIIMEVLHVAFTFAGIWKLGMRMRRDWRRCLGTLLWLHVCTCLCCVLRFCFADWGLFHWYHFSSQNLHHFQYGGQWLRITWSMSCHCRDRRLSNLLVRFFFTYVYLIYPNVGLFERYNNLAPVWFKYSAGTAPHHAFEGGGRGSHEWRHRVKAKWRWGHSHFNVCGRKRP